MNTPDAPLPTPPGFPPEARAFDAEAFAHARGHWEDSFALAHLPRLAAEIEQPPAILLSPHSAPGPLGRTASLATV